MMKKFCLLFTLLLAACADDGGSLPAASAPAAPEYRVFTDHSYPPFVMHGGGKVSGFEYDILEAVAAKQNLRLKYIAHPWQNLFKNLDDNKADIISSGVSITEERRQQMLFSEPYFETESVLLVSDRVPNLKHFSQFNGMNVLVQQETSQEETVRNGGGKPEYADTMWRLVSGLLDKRADAAMGDFGVMSYYAKRYQKDGLRLIRDPAAEKEQLAFALKKDNTALQAKLNEGLAQIKADGSYDKIYQKWFGDAEQ